MLHGIASSMHETARQTAPIAIARARRHRAAPLPNEQKLSLGFVAFPPPAGADETAGVARTS